LITDGEPFTFDERGRGLPAVYDGILTRDVESYREINQQVRRLFPWVKSLRLKNTSNSTKALGVELLDGTHVSSQLMSEGLLYFLAFAALPYLQPTALLLIEEPENGLHPARIAEVMRILRAVSEKMQVIIATHSPLVINELKGDEVTVVTRTPEKGTQAILLKDTPNFEQRAKVYALGELWVSYSNGQDEAPLLNPVKPGSAE